MKLCGVTFGGIDTCILERGHRGCHVGMDATWEPDLFEEADPEMPEDEHMGYDTTRERDMDREE